MKERYRGILFTALSAVFFGLTPVLARSAYDGGANGISMTFLRALLALPVLFVLVRARGVPLKMEPDEWRGVLLTGGLGTALTSILLYSSYSYIPVGMATTLHFIYPLLVAAACVFLFRERLGPLKVVALVCGAAGILLFLDRGAPGGALGMGLALLSGVSYSFYIIYLDQSGLKNLYYFKLTFWLCAVMGVVAGGFGLLTGTLSLHLTPKAWLFACLVALFSSVGAVTLFQVGIRMIGASAAAILSTLEPITSVLLGVLVLHEELTLPKLGGCACILASVVLITLAESGRSPDGP